MAKDGSKPTKYPGIVQLSNGRYKVTIDYGRDEVTGKQRKTHKTVDTLKEARALQGQNADAKRFNRTTGISGKVLFKDALVDYNATYEKDWSMSYRTMKHNQEKRMLAYFGDKDVRTISTLDIEAFFKWCQEPHEGFQKELCNNTIGKYRTHLSDIWVFMKKNKQKYGISENVVSDAKIGKIEKYEATTLTPEQIKYLLTYVTHCEEDYSTFALLGIPALVGVRRGELCGLQWGDIDFENKIIDIQRQRDEINSQIVESVPKMGNPDGKSRFEKRQRYSALPDKFAELLLVIKANQESILERPVTASNYVYVTKRNMVSGTLPRPGKVSKRWRELLERCNMVRKNKGLEEFPIVRLHDLRHSFISMCLNGGVNQLQVSANCGHTFSDRHLSTTIKTYWHDNQDRTELREFLNRTFQDANINVVF